jgi:hypothetical protein
MAKELGYHCGTCGQHHNELPMSFGFEAPLAWYGIPAAERADRGHLDTDLCVIDRVHFFIRGNLEIPVVDGQEPFTWGVWTSLSEANYRRAVEMWKTTGREKEPSYFGWFCSRVPGYPETLHLKVRVHTRPVGQRPWIELEPTDHPLAVEQREGITMARVQQIAESLLHGPGESRPAK